MLQALVRLQQSDALLPKRDKSHSRPLRLCLRE